MVIDVNGVGYVVQVPVTTLSGLPEEGREVFLHVHTHVREDAISLFGFSSESEKRIFITLLGVSGVGPKMAVNILSGISSNEFLEAVQREDVAALCRIPGLGKKTAGRLILELKEKLPSSGRATDRVFEDALSALVNFGYKKTLAQEYLEKVYRPGQGSIEELIRDVLKQLNANGT